jgi:hypothetical protein
MGAGRLAFSCPTSSFDGRYWAKYPNGNAPQPFGGSGSILAAASGQLNSAFRSAALAAAAASGNLNALAAAAAIGSSAAGTFPKSYATSFPATENPISEGGIWTNGAATGLDWTNVQTTAGLAFATQTIHSHPPFDDSIAILNGYHADQFVSGVIHNASSNSREVELILRGTITAHSATLYEIDITQSNGLDLARWNGALNDYTALGPQGTTSGVSLANGAVWYAQIVGTVITVKCNGTTVLTYDTASDSVKLTSGSPGMGFYGDLEAGSPTANNTLGWASFAAGEL